jgi:predicted metal-dependent peptidase
MENKDYNQIYRDYVQQSQQNVISEERENQEMGKEKIVAVRKNDDGDLIAFKTETGRELDYVTALDEAKSGNLAHVDVFHKYGRDILRSEPDGIKENNLDQLTQF